MQEKKRIAGLDVVRTVALLFIIGVHVFYHNGFYGQVQKGFGILLGDVLRWLTFSCVPLFIILTGYLKCRAELCKKYYKGIVPVLMAWVIISILCMVFRITYLHVEKTPFEWLVEFFNYKAADYSWYIELYIGLFALCPFLNRMFNWEADRSYHNALVVTMLLTAFVPSLVNNVILAASPLEVIPNYFVGLWPFAYYFTGCYICKYGCKIPLGICLLFAIVFSVFKGLLTFITANGHKFNDGIAGGYSDFFVACITILVFLSFYRVNAGSSGLRKIFSHISKRSLCIYLLSSIPDAFANKLFLGVNAPVNYYWVFPARVLFVFAIALILSEIVYPVTMLLSRLIYRCFEAKGDGHEN